MITEPVAVDPTPEQVAELEDSYFGSNPLLYFGSRIQALLHDPGTSADDAAAFGDLLGPAQPDWAAISPSDRQLQRAVDAFSVRHHAAESLVRLLHALIVTPAGSSIWAGITEGPLKTVDIVSHLAETFRVEPEKWAEYVLPADLLQGFDGDPNLHASVFNSWQWTEYAGNLLVSSDLDINAAHNRTKHGLAIRAKDDERIDFVAIPVGTEGPDLSNGTVPLSFLNEAVAVLDKPLVKHLSRPKVGGHKQGLEISTLRLDTPVVLAEAWMIARVHDCLFANAAQSRSSSAPEYRVFPQSPSPSDVFPRGSVVGMRHPVTLPQGGGPLSRQPGVALNGLGFRTLTFDYENGATVTVVEG